MKTINNQNTNNINNVNNVNLENKNYYLAFSHFQKIGPRKMVLLENYFPDIHSAYYANGFDLEHAGVEPKLVSEFINWRQDFNLEKIKNNLIKENINFITWHEADYPALLKEISTPPFILYYQGNIENLNNGHKNRLAIVGSRKHSAYADKIITEFIPVLTENDIEIISGLALGVDALAHQTTLDNNGRTIAVLGTGLDYNSFYPRVNRALAKKIVASGGLLLSEFPPGTQALKQNFPQRNRIISGLCQATLVIEAKIKSGSLITADYALDQNREVLAVPGNIFSEFSGGTNNLIKLGAKSINEPKDILEIFKIENGSEYYKNQDNGKGGQEKRNKTSHKIILTSEAEKIVYAILQQASERAEKITTDEIIRISQLDTAVINSTLSILELRGIAKTDGISYDIN
jgi:DNA processing protein